MLGVLMRDASPDRRWPAPAEIADLVWGCAVAWLRRAGGGLRSGGWPAVGGVLGLLLPFAMVAYSLPLDVGLIRLWPAYQGHHREMLSYLLYPETALIAWAVVLVLAVTRWRRAAVAGAWMLAAFQVVVLVARWPVGLFSSYEGCWPVLAVVAATALTIRGRRAAAGLLGPLGVVAGLAACLLAVLAYPPLHLTFPFVLVRRLPPGAFLVARHAEPVLVVLMAVLLAVVAVRVTRRAGLGVMLRLVAVLAALGVLFLGGSLGSSVGSSAGPYLVARWLGPALAFGLVLLGARLAERAPRAPGHPVIGGERSSPRPGPHSPSGVTGRQPACGSRTIGLFRWRVARVGGSDCAGPDSTDVDEGPTSTGGDRVELGRDDGGRKP